MKRKLNRSAVTGKLVTKDYAKKNKATTVTETVDVKELKRSTTISLTQDEHNLLKESAKKNYTTVSKLILLLITDETFRLKKFQK